jgi:hypothetical protein
MPVGVRKTCFFISQIPTAQIRQIATFTNGPPATVTNVGQGRRRAHDVRGADAGFRPDRHAMSLMTR